MTEADCKKVVDAVVDAFYARHPEVLDAAFRDVLLHGRGTISFETERLIHHAFGVDLLEPPPQ